METNTFSATNETKNNNNNKKVNIQQEDISKKNHLQDGKHGINSKSLILNNTTVVKTCNDIQSVGSKKDSKQVFIAGDSIIKHLNGYVVLGKTENCNVYARPSHGAKVRCMVDHIKPVIRVNQIILSSMLELMTSHYIKMQEILQNQFLTW